MYIICQNMGEVATFFTIPIERFFVRLTPQEGEFVADISTISYHQQQPYVIFIITSILTIVMNDFNANLDENLHMLYIYVYNIKYTYNTVCDVINLCDDTQIKRRS